MVYFNEKKIIDSIKKDTGFIDRNDFKIVKLTSNECIIEYEIKKDGLNPMGITHGGLLFGLMDTACGSLAFMTGKNCVTTSGNINYLMPVKEGKIYAIRGRSGTGKTTLLSLISGLERCTDGKIIFDGKDLKDVNLDYYRSHDIGIVFQSYNLLPFMTVSENIILCSVAS